MNLQSDSLSPSVKWTASRVARPTRDLASATRFYRDLLGLPVRGDFEDHAGYDGVFFALPGGGELEITAGAGLPGAASDDGLLVLYAAGREDVEVVARELRAAGVRPVSSTNPYWTRWGHTFLDPDGYRVVAAARDTTAGAITIDWHDGPRAELRALFELAEDSAAQLDEYMEAGRVLVARRDTDLIGHLQLVQTGRRGQIELKNMAVRTESHGTGVGRALVEAAIAWCTAEGLTELLVATGAADVGNLRFYQRVGFRMLSVERDAFTPATGYAERIMIDGIELRDRVWLSASLTRG